MGNSEPTKDSNITTKDESSSTEHEPKISLSFDSELRGFIDNITSLSSTLDLSMKSISDAFISAEKDFEDFQKHFVKVKNEDGNHEMLIKAEKYYEFTCCLRKLKAYALALQTIPRSYVISLVSAFDAFLGRLLKVVFISKPELFTNSEKNLTFSQLMEFGSIDDAKDYILEKEIESLLRESHVKQFSELENRFHMTLKKDLTIWPSYVELTERRNLFVHSGGIVSNQYIKVCQENDIELGDIKCGDELTVNQEYFNNAYETVFEMGFKLAQVLWRKFKPDELNGADDNLCTIGYDTLFDENYKLTKIIFDFALHSLPKISDENLRLVMLINLALATKYSGDEKRAIEIIKNEDWSATRGKFRLAEAVILRKYHDAYKIMREIGNNRQEVPQENYKDWPLFKEIRNETEFQLVYKEIFQEPFNKVEESTLELDSQIDNAKKSK